MLELGILIFLLMIAYATSRGHQLRSSSGSMDRINLVLEDGRRQRDLKNYQMELKRREYITRRSTQGVCRRRELYQNNREL